MAKLRIENNIEIVVVVIRLVVMGVVVMAMVMVMVILMMMVIKIDKKYLFSYYLHCISQKIQKKLCSCA